MWPLLFTGLRDTKEKNEKWLDSLNELLVEKFDEIGYEAVTTLAGNHGASCFVISRKYPNLYSKFTISDSYVSNSITWIYYINEKKWASFEISLTALLSILDLIEEPKHKRRWFKKKNHNEKKNNVTITTDYLDNLIKNTLDTYGLKSSPYKFVYQDKESDLEFELDKDTDWFSNNSVYVYCYVKDFQVVKEEFHIDQAQYTLLNKYKNFALKNNLK